MAVSMNAGYMRSDYMISDAAMPMRMEELEQLEQSAKFSEILGEFGDTPANDVVTAPVEKAEPASEVSPGELAEVADDDRTTIILSKAELKALARSVIEGKIKLSDLPEELVSDVLLMAIAMMMLGIPEDEIPALQEDRTITVTEAEMQAMSEYVSVIIVPKLNGETAAEQQSVKTESGLEISDELMAEVQSIISKIVSFEDEDTSLLADVNTKSENGSEIKPVGFEASVDLTAENVQNVVTNSSSAQQNSFGGQNNAAETARANQTVSADQLKLDEEFEQLKKIISEITVKKSDPEQTTQQTFSTQQTFGTESSAKGRLVSKSDELIMLKNAANSTSEQPIAQSAVPQAQIVFTRPDGSELTVKPADVMEQVTTSIVEQATTTAEGETEYSITLTPEDLGSITVKLTKAADGALTVSIAADNARTQRILEESGLALQNSLRQNGIELESWQTINESQQEARAQDYSGSSKNPYYQEDNNSDNSDADDNSFAELISAM